jgi:hypothetical protein
MMGCPGYVPAEGYDRPTFWREANTVLAEGTREMLLNARDKEGLLSAFDRMDYKLGEVVGRWDPPANVRAELNKKLEDRIALLGRVMRAGNVHAEQYWDADMKRVSYVVLKAIGRTGAGVVRLETIVSDAMGALCEGNFTREGAQRLLLELSTFGCKDLGSLLSSLEDSPSHMEFLRFLSRNGMPKAQAAARKVLNNLVPSEPKVMARVIALPAARMQPVNLRIPAPCRS